MWIHIVHQRKIYFTSVMSLSDFTSTVFDGGGGGGSPAEKCLEKNRNGTYNSASPEPSRGLKEAQSCRGILYQKRRDVWIVFLKKLFHAGKKGKRCAPPAREDTRLRECSERKENKSSRGQVVVSDHVSRGGDGGGIGSPVVWVQLQG
jgi:hypothetical protein